MKKYWLPSVLFACALLGMSAMAQAAAPLSVDYVVANLKKGVTTRAEVLKAFGEPTRKDVRVSSESGALETYTYSTAPAAPQAPAKKKKGGGMGAFIRVARDVAGDVSEITGKSYGSDVSERLNQAERLGNRVDSATEAAEEESAPAPQSAPAITLVISLANGVVSGYEMN